VSYVNFFSSERGKRILAGGIRRSGRYKAIIERALREEGLPPELIFLAQAESGFLPRAVSNKLCVGLWQFAKFRGAEYGLTQTSATDDRMDPEKATRAAARHLHDLYTHFGDWYLAMAAYDCGPGCVDHAVMRTGYADFWALRRMNVLPKETANYVPVILAMIIVAKNAKDYGLELGAYDPPMEFETIELQTPTHLALIAEAVDRPISELKDLNPALLRAVAPAGYAVHVPVGTVEAVERAFAIVPAGRRDAWRLHRMEAGDTFAALAKRYKSDTLMIASANHQALPEAGSWAAIPVSYPGDRTPARVSSKTGASKPKTAASKTPLTRKKPAATQHRVTASNKSAASNKSSAKPVLAKTSGTAL
jgi:membrane-bound lytic murein transglycosylase D